MEGTSSDELRRIVRAVALGVALGFLLLSVARRARRGIDLHAQPDGGGGSGRE